MKWENVFLSGLVLSFAPFYINYGNFTFHYSILGYGLMLFSFYYKDALDKIDTILISNLILLIFCGVFNWFNLYYFFSFLFFIFCIIKVNLYSKNKIVKFLSYFFVFAGGIFITFIYVGINGQNYFLNFFYYLFGIYLFFAFILK